MVSGARRLAACCTGATRGPAGRAAATARWTGEPGSRPEPSYGLGPASARSAPSSAAATGSDSAGSPKPAPEGAAAGVRASRSSPPGAPSSTACESDPEKDGFCQVASREAKSAVATACPAERLVARWISGRLFQSRPEAPTAAGAAGVGAAVAGPEEAGAAGVGPEGA
ncbi:hypothetical protein [Streptomyces sp. NBC_00455]|uniref:hypothetical protein n=1 Tax=Streptomyces sp. NBC_00455 TaxID=2903654 RepID=UPI002E1C946B